VSRLTFDPGVPLSHYRQHEAGVLLICESCVYVRSLPLEAVISRLVERGVGDENTGTRAVAKLTRGPCPECGARNWTTRPDFPSRPGQDGITRRLPDGKPD
jgi:hypothetical protein